MSPKPTVLQSVRTAVDLDCGEDGMDNGRPAPGAELKIRQYAKWPPGALTAAETTSGHFGHLVPLHLFDIINMYYLYTSKCNSSATV